jgi:hypothetical protein
MPSLIFHAESKYGGFCFNPACRRHGTHRSRQKVERNPNLQTPPPSTVSLVALLNGGWSIT